MKSSSAAPEAFLPAAGSAGVTELFVIQNPAAGPRHPTRLRRRIEGALSGRAVRYEYEYTREPGHGSELVARALAEGYSRFLVAGGDGTVLEAASVLAGTDAALALLPVGTGNQLAASLGVPRSLRRSVDVAIGGGVRRIDLGLINGQPFTSIAGAGFDAEIVRPRPRLKRRIGYLAYVHAAMRAAIAPRTADLRIVVDGEEFRARGAGVEVTNLPGLAAPWLTGPIPIVPEGSLDDGLLDGCAILAETTLQICSAVMGIVTRRFDRSPYLSYFRGRRISVEADPPLPIQADGELLGTTPFEANVRSSALNVVIPTLRANA